MDGYYKNRGITLLELIVTTAITSIILSVGIPTLSSAYKKAKADTSTTIIHRALSFARITAIEQQLHTTVCGTHNMIDCVNKNFSFLMIFVDTNNNKKRDEEEKILNSLQLYYKGQKWLQASFGRKYIRYKPTGSSEQAGSFILCDKDNPYLTRRVTLSTSGRVYKARPNKKNIIRDASGKKIKCL